MRRILPLVSVFLLCCTLAFSQSRIISGKIISEDASPVAFASIRLANSKIGTSADAYGAFVIRAKTGDKLEISGTGFNLFSQSVNEGSVYNVILTRKANTIQEVVVTGAFNTKRTARSTSANAQTVTAEALNIIRSTDVNNALAGKVAGIQVRSQSSAALGKETNIRVRGESNAGGAASGPIYVIDGTIMPASNDINPDDIESLTVLQGPQGAALFGPDGANGAIVITTKVARKNTKGLGIDINTGMQFDKIYILPNYQNSYAGGGVYDLIKFKYTPGMPEAWKPLDGKFYPDYTDDASWGPRMTGQEYIPWYAWYPGTEYTGKTARLTPQPNNSKDFFNTGVTLLNNISLSKATEGASVRLSYTNQDQKGLIATSYLKKHNLNLNTSFDLGNNFTLRSNITYLTQKTNSENDDGYSNNSTGNLNSWFHRDLDMGILREFADYKTQDGVLASWNHSNPSSYNPSNPSAFYKGNFWFNPYSYFNNISNINNKDRLFGNVSLSYKFSPSFSVTGTYRKQFVTSTEERTISSELQASASQASINNSFSDGVANIAPNNGKAFYGTRENTSNRNIYELVGTYTKKIKDVQINANAGIEIVSRQSKDSWSQTLGGFTVPNLFALSNSINPINYYNRRVYEKRRAVFARGDIGWKNLLFAEFVTRVDYSSTLPKNQELFSKSFGTSFVFSDLIKEQTPWLSFGKIRASYGEVTRLLNPYDLATTYALGAQTWNGNGLISTPNTVPDPNLIGAIARTKEAGIELRFLKNRVGITTTYYVAEDVDAPIDAQVSGTSGVTVVKGNFGSVKRKGIDVQLNLKPFVGKNFGWEINGTFSKILENTVVKIAPGVDRLAFSAGASFNGIAPPITVNAVGQQWGQMYGGGAQRINGQMVMDADGIPTKGTDLTYFGSVLPDYTGGIQNSFNIFKNFVLNVNIDYQVGGKFFSLSDMWGSYSGLTARTAVLNDKGNSIRDAPADGGGVHSIGVDANGKPFDKYVDAQKYFHSLVERNIFDSYIYDLGFVKMRELSLGYKLPIGKMGLGKYVNSATFSIVARNPWLIYAKTKDFDPSEINSVFGEDGQLPGTRSLGVNLRIGF
jgi:TonB-linked SusC/RagA family outer membrane protein